MDRASACTLQWLLVCLLAGATGGPAKGPDTDRPSTDPGWPAPKIPCTYKYVPVRGHYGMGWDEMGWDGMGERKKPESAWGQGVIDACRTGQTQALTLSGAARPVALALAACACTCTCTCPCRLRQVLCPTTAVDMIRQVVSFSNAPTGELRLAWLSGVPVHLGRTRYYCTTVIKTTSMYM